MEDPVVMEIILSLVLSAAAVDHPVYEPAYSAGDVETLKKQTATVVAMPLDELAAMVPSASGIFYCGCPSCDGGAQEHAMIWALGMGDRVKCRHCGMQFPNEKFPNNCEKTITAPSGATQVYRWHKAANGREYFYEARAWYERWQWTRTTALKLANLYALTKDDTYGDRAAAIVGRYAQVYPDYAIRFDYPFQPVRFWPADQKWPYDKDLPPFRGAKFYWWGFGDIPVQLARAYDLLLTGDSIDRLKTRLGEDIGQKIEKDLIRLGYEFVAANPDDHGNMSPGTYTDMIVAGRIIGAPDMVHEGVSRTRELVGKQFFADGWWRECAPSYHWQTVGNLLNVAKAAKGYSDPADWPEPRLTRVDLLADIPTIQRAVDVGMQGCLPNGRLMPQNDTWWSGRKKPLDTSISRLWPAMGRAILGAGKGKEAFQTHIDWGARYGHTHADSGAILLYAHEKELLSDIGYTHTRYRNWTINSASHNMVVVDQRSQPLAWNDTKQTGNVLFFDDSDPHVNAIDLDAQPAYPQCAVYRRRLVHVHVDEGRDYLVDCFDVEGGKEHDYFLYGSADEDGAFDASLPFATKVETLIPAWGGTQEYTGENCIDTSGETYHPYQSLWNIHSAPAAGPWTAHWRYGDTGLDSHLFPEGDTTLFRFQAPSVRRARSDDTKLGDYRMHGIMQRHGGGASQFRAVHVPYQGDASWVKEVRFEEGAFHVTYGDVTDQIRWDGSHLVVESSAGWRYDSGKAVSGPIKAVERGKTFAFQADRPLPKAGLVRLDFGSARSVVYRVKKTEGDRFVLDQDPGFSYDPATREAQFLGHPHEKIVGTLQWTVWE